MENIKYLITKAYIAPMINFLMYWLMQTPLQSLDEAYLFVIAGTIGVVFTIIVLGVPMDIVTLLFQTQFCPGETFKEKWKYRMEQRKTRKAIIQKEWPNGFLYRYLNKLNYMGAFIISLGAILLKSVSFLCIGIPIFILVIVHNNRIKKRFNYELYANTDLALNLVAFYIMMFLLIHYVLNHNLR